MATYGNIPKYHDQNLPRPDLQGLPHILSGVPGLCPVASCDDGYESRTHVKKNNVVNKDLPRCSKMFQLTQKDVWISGHLFLNFRRSLLQHVSYDLTKSGKHGKRRSMSPFSKPHGCGSPGHQIPYFVLLRTAKKKIDPLVKMVSKTRHLVWSSL